MTELQPSRDLVIDACKCNIAMWEKASMPEKAMPWVYKLRAMTKPQPVLALPKPQQPKISRADLMAGKTDATRKKVMSFMDRPMIVSEISDRSGMHTSNVRKTLHALKRIGMVKTQSVGTATVWALQGMDFSGYDGRPRGSVKLDVLRMINEGHTDKEIADHLSCADAYVRKVARDNSLPTSTKRAKPAVSSDDAGPGLRVGCLDAHVAAVRARLGAATMWRSDHLTPDAS